MLEHVYMHRPPAPGEVVQVLRALGAYMRLIAAYLCDQVLCDLKWLWNRLPQKLLYDLLIALLVELILRIVIQLLG